MQTLLQQPPRKRATARAMAEAEASTPVAETEAAPEVDFGKKHPLEHTWTLWFDNPDGRQRTSTFGATLRSVYTFSTVEDFWW